MCCGKWLLVIYISTEGLLMLWSVTGDGQVAGQSAKFRKNIVDLDKCSFKKHARLQRFQLLPQTTVFLFFNLC